jgi:hypothetical protein
MTVDSGSGDHGDVVASDELDDAAVVVGMRVGDEDGQERLRQRLEPRAQGAALGDRERAVHRNDALVSLDEVGVNEPRLGPGRVSVDAGLVHRALLRLVVN